MLQDAAIHKQQGECVVCAKPSKRKCCLCGLFWHPRCASTVLRKISTQEFFASVRQYPTAKIVRDSLKPLGELAWKSLTEDVVPVLQNRPEGGKQFDFLPNVQMKLGCDFMFSSWSVRLPFAHLGYYGYGMFFLSANLVWPIQIASNSQI